MSKARSTGNISNVIKTSTTCVTVTDGTTDLLIISGSGRVTIPGDLVVLGGIAGSSAESASYSLSSSFATNANLLDGIDGASFLQTGSFNTFSSSIDTTIKNKLNNDGVISGSVQVDITSTTGYSTFSSSLSSSIGSLSGSVATTTSGLAGRIGTIEGRYATTGSNTFIGDQTITGSICSTGNIVTTGQIVAQTINVQQVTSSIVYSCGSNTFGCSLTNNQVFTGSVFITGSNINANVDNVCFQGSVCAQKLRICSTGDLSYIYNSGASTTDANFYIYNSTSDILMIRNSGCVGLNTANPQARLDIAGNNNNATCRNTLRFTDTDTGTQADQQIGKIEFYSSDTSSPGAGVKAYMGAFASDSTPDAYLAFATQDGSLTPDPVERLRITSEGNLQVGYSGAPNIAGKLFISRGDQYGLTINAFSGGNCIISTDDNMYFTFGTTPALRMICNLVSCFAGTICSPLGVLGEVQLTTTNPRIDYPNGSSLRIYQIGQDTRLEISSTGIATFACQVCVIDKLTVQNGINNVFAWGNTTDAQPGLQAVGCIGSATTELYSKLYMNTNAGLFGQSTECMAFIGTAGDCNRGLLLGTVNTAPLYIGTANTLRISILSNGSVGIGTATPGSTLPTGGGVLVTNGWGFSAAICASRKVVEIDANNDDGGNVGLFLRQPNNSTGLDIWSDSFYGNTYIDSRYDSSASYLTFRFRTNCSNNLVNTMAITAAGNVSIGSCTPCSNFLLDIYQSQTSTTAYSRIRNNRSRNAALQLETNCGNYLVGVGIGADINQFQIYDNTAGSSRLVISSTGQFIVGALNSSLTRNASIVGVSGFSVQQDNNSGTYFDVIPNAAGGTVDIKAGALTGACPAMTFYTCNVERMRITSTGNILPGANGTQDLGSSSLRWCTVYTSDLSLNNGIGNYTIVEGENDLFIYNNNSCKVYKFLLQEVCPEMAPAKRSI
jgi:hypothetical protein